MGGESNIFQEEAPRLEVDLQRLLDYWIEIRSNNISSSSGEGERNQKGGDAAGRRQQGFVRSLRTSRITPSHRCTVESPAGGPDWLFSAEPSRGRSLPCSAPYRPARECQPPTPTPVLTRCWCCTSRKCGAWVGWPAPWRWAGRTGGSADWAGRQVCHLGVGRQTH